MHDLQQTAPSNSNPPEVLTEAVAEVNLEHTCDYVGVCYPAVPTSCLIYEPHSAAVHHVSSLTQWISRKSRQPQLLSQRSCLRVKVVCRSLCALPCSRWNHNAVAQNILTTLTLFCIKLCSYPTSLCCCIVLTVVHKILLRVKSTQPVHAQGLEQDAKCCFLLFTCLNLYRYCNI